MAQTFARTQTPADRFLAAHTEQPFLKAITLPGLPPISQVRLPVAEAPAASASKRHKKRSRRAFKRSVLAVRSEA